MTTLEEPAPPVHATALLSAALRGEPCLVHGLGDLPTTLPVRRWSACADSSDVSLLDQCTGPVLDVGCGPGRMSEHLARCGTDVFAIDVAQQAVDLARARGVSVWRRDVFDALPAEGRWSSVLLADGNIGIGGDPVRLLRRVGALLAPDGRVVADLDAPGSWLTTRTVELECGGLRSRPFRWSRLGPDAAYPVAAAAGLAVRSVHQHLGRWFAVLERGDR